MYPSATTSATSSRQGNTIAHLRSPRTPDIDNSTQPGHFPASIFSTLSKSSHSYSKSSHSHSKSLTSQLIPNYKGKGKAKADYDPITPTLPTDFKLQNQYASPSNPFSTTYQTEIGKRQSRNLQTPSTSFHFHDSSRNLGAGLKRRSSNPSNTSLDFYGVNGIRNRIRLSLELFKNSPLTPERIWDLVVTILFWFSVAIFFSALLGIGYIPLEQSLSSDKSLSLGLDTDISKLSETLLSSYPTVIVDTDTDIDTLPTSTIISQVETVPETEIPETETEEVDDRLVFPIPKGHKSLIKGAMKNLSPGIWKMGKGSRKGDREIVSDVREINRQKLAAILAGEHEGGGLIESV